jgi:hypothetical protein
MDVPSDETFLFTLKWSYYKVLTVQRDYDLQSLIKAAYIKAIITGIKHKFKAETPNFC